MPITPLSCQIKTSQMCVCVCIHTQMLMTISYYCPVAIPNTCAKPILSFSYKHQSVSLYVVHQLQKPSKYSTPKLEKKTWLEKNCRTWDYAPITVYLLPPSSFQSSRYDCFSSLAPCSSSSRFSEIRLGFISFCWSSQSSQMRTCRVPTSSPIHGAVSRPHTPHSFVEPTSPLWRPLTYVCASLTLGHQSTDTVDFLLWLYPLSSPITTIISLPWPPPSQTISSLIQTYHTWKWKASLTHQSSSVFFFIVFYRIQENVPI